MEEVLLFIRILLAGVFAIAGIGKLLDAAGSAKAARAFGVPDNLAVPVGAALPIVEIAVAICLLLTAASWFGAIGATILLTVFVGGMLWQFSQGRAPDCHCFGQIHSEPVGVKSIARNIILLSFALLLVIAGRAGQGFPLATTYDGTIQTLLLFVIAALMITALAFVKRILDSQEETSRKIELLELLSSADVPKERQEAGDPSDALPLGAVLPDFSLKDIAGHQTELASVLAPQLPVLFFFLGPNCAPCKALLPEISEWITKLAGKIEIVLITSGTANENREKLELAEGVRVLIDTDRAYAQSVYAKWTPSALLVRPDGRVASRMAAGDTAIRQLVEKVDASADSELLYIANGKGNGISKLKIGQRVPDFSVATAQGSELHSQDLTGRETLAVFWSTTCPHCVAMMSELKQWDLQKGADQPNLVIFSEGDQVEHANLGLRSPIVLEAGNKTAIELGMSGTPSAVLINADGVIVSETAIGARNIWALVGKN
jgi:thiol-disulfide isomerase/thioredoxin/uncharacterized membrane protein YphA (DoxX/SURF4 family)